MNGFTVIRSPKSQKEMHSLRVKNRLEYLKNIYKSSLKTYTVLIEDDEKYFVNRIEYEIVENNNQIQLSIFDLGVQL